MSLRRRMAEVAFTGGGREKAPAYFKKQEEQVLVKMPNQEPIAGGAITANFKRGTRDKGRRKMA